MEHDPPTQDLFDLLDTVEDLRRLGLPIPPAQALQALPWESRDKFLIDFLHWRAAAKRTYLKWLSNLPHRMELHS